MQPDIKKNIDPARDITVQLAQALVRIPSLTPVELQHQASETQVLDLIAGIAKKSGADVTCLEFRGDHSKWDYPVQNLYLEWTFGKPEKHLCYMGHLDVVPPGDPSKWSADPYSGAIEGGYLYGRGVTDMKGSVAAFLSSIEEMQQDLKDNANIRISMILTMDEEWAAVNGSRKVLDWMKSQGKTPDAFIVGEPSSQDILGSHLKVGRRGSLCGTLNAKGVQGHAAYQGLFENPNRALILAAAILNGHSWKDGNEYFPNTNFETIAVKSGDFGASAIVPETAELLWNIRFTSDHTPESLEQWVKEALANPPDWAKSHPDAALLKNITVTANRDTASKPYYSAPAQLAAAAKEAIKSVLSAVPVMDGSGGTTDGRFAAEIFPDSEIIELGLPEHGGVVKNKKPDDYLNRGGMHQINERAALSDLIQLRYIFEKTVTNYDRKKEQSDIQERKPGCGFGHLPPCG